MDKHAFTGCSYKPTTSYSSTADNSAAHSNIDPNQTPTPIRSPQEQVDTAKHLLRLQDYALARQELNTLLTSPNIEPSMRLESLFTLARVEYEDPSIDCRFGGRQIDCWVIPQ